MMLTQLLDLYPKKTAKQSKETPNKYQDDEYKTQLQNLVKLVKSGSTNNKHYRNNILYLYNLCNMLKYIHIRHEYLEQYAEFQLIYSHVIDILTYYLDCNWCMYYFYYSVMFIVQPPHTFLSVPHKLESIPMARKLVNSETSQPALCHTKVHCVTSQPAVPSKLKSIVQPHSQSLF